MAPTLDAVEDSVGLPEDARVHLERAYDSKKTRRLLEERGLVGVLNEKGKPAPLTAGLRWIVERTNSWHNAHNKLVWCTEREEPVIDFWISFSNVIIVWYEGSCGKPGDAIDGRADLFDAPDQLAQPLRQAVAKLQLMVTNVASPWQRRTCQRWRCSLDGCRRRCRSTNRAVLSSVQ